MTTPHFGLALPVDGQIPWGDDIRENFTVIDGKLPYVRAIMYVHDNATVTDIVTQGVAVKANVPGTLGVSPCGCFTFPTGNRMLYSGVDRVLAVNASFSVDSSNPNEHTHVTLSLNGSLIDHSQTTVRIGSAGDIGTASMNALVDVVAGDYLELWISNESSANDLTVTDLSVAVRG